VPLLKTTAALQRVEFEQIALPWLRCLREVANGTVAGAIGASYSDERAAFAVYPSTADGLLDVSRRMQSSSYSLFRVKGGNAGWDGKKFSNLVSRVVVQRGYAVVADLTKLGVLVDQSASDADTVLRMLVAGRSQLGALVTEQGEDLMAKPEFRRQFEKIDPPLVVKTYYLVFGKRYYDANTRLVEELWDNLAVVRDAKDPDSLLRLKTGR
jgi:polar amino acid transport system substrate-binding protein